ncbi:MAG: electron transport complex subunit RsxB [Wenzhouxiangellaceae bacterium]
MLTAIVVLTGLLLAIGAALLGLARRYSDGSSQLVEQIDAQLPQTQCGQCGYPGCRPYAQAIAEGRAPINQCPPGGDDTIRALADLLGIEPEPLDTTRGTHKGPIVALIDEQRCIGCTLCIQACPVDAIIGGPKLMHTVLEADCTGCELCLPPCPVDCIEMVPRPEPWLWPAPESRRIELGERSHG